LWVSLVHASSSYLSQHREPFFRRIPIVGILCNCPDIWTAIMSVLLETSAGDIVIDLLVDYAPKMCEK
jgi:hypothetical protein